MTSPHPRRSRRLLGAVALGTLALAACTSSTPSSKRVALDIVETMGGEGPGDLTVVQQDCMVGKINTYSDDQLEAIANAPENLSMVASDPPTFNYEEGTPELQAFVDDLKLCMSENPRTETTDATATTASDTATTVPATTTSP